MNPNLDRRRIANLLPKQGEWFRIVNKADEDTTEIYIYDEISFWGITAQDFLRELQGVDSSNINLHIHSDGGDVFDGIAIYNGLRSHPAYVTVRVDSMAASIASVIVQAGDKRIMVEHSQMMIHDAQALGVGNADDFREFADLLDKQSDLIADIYAERKGDKRSKSKIRNLMKATTYLMDDEAVELGLADEVEVPRANGQSNGKVVTSTTESIEDRIDWVSVFNEAVPDEMAQLEGLLT